MSKNEWTDEQRAMAIADLYERAAKAVREGRASDAKEVALRACRIADGCNNHGSHYGNALFFARVERSDVEAAMLAISENRPPVDSLHGQVVDVVKKSWHARNMSPATYPDEQAYGRLDAMNRVLRWIGIKA